MLHLPFPIASPPAAPSPSSIGILSSRPKSGGGGLFTNGRFTPNPSPRPASSAGRKTVPAPSPVKQTLSNPLLIVKKIPTIEVESAAAQSAADRQREASAQREAAAKARLTARLPAATAAAGAISSLSSSSSSSSGAAPRTPRKPPRFCVIAGNNKAMVVEVMSRRTWWTETEDVEKATILWRPTVGGIDFRDVAKRDVWVNHLDNPREVCNKANLAANLQSYAQTQKVDIHDFFPKTFVIRSGLTDPNFIQFRRCFVSGGTGDAATNLNTTISSSFSADDRLSSTTGSTVPSLAPPSPAATTSTPGPTATTPRRQRGLGTPRAATTPAATPTSTSTSISTSTAPLASAPAMSGPGSGRSNAGRVWIMKPQGLNRGAGISVVDTLKDAEAYVLAKTACIAQKYVERPLLFDGRKFDLRVYALFTSDLAVYMYDRGYLRTSNTKFTLDTLDNSVHLTNHAIQKHSPSYGLYEAGNFASFEMWQAYADKNGLGLDIAGVLVPQLRDMVHHSALSARKNIHRSKYKSCFEIFGYDFILSDQLKPYLIEINTNPSLEKASDVVLELIPKMLDDAFKLTLDVAFPPPPDITWPPEGSPKNEWTLVLPAPI
jgi:hypothetical protein